MEVNDCEKNELKNVHEIDTFLAKINKYSDKKYMNEYEKKDTFESRTSVLPQR